MTFSTEPLGKQHDRASFSCGDEALDRYLRERASQDARNHVAAIFVSVHETGKISGFYTLSGHAIDINDLPEEISRKAPRYPKLPATLIGGLAVDRSAQGEGVGRLLLLDALCRSLEGSRKIASFAVVIDAKNEDAEAFYRHFGFARLTTSASRLFLSMRTIEGLFVKSAK